MPPKININLEQFKKIYLSNKYSNKQIADIFQISLGLFYIIKRKLNLKKKKQFIDIEKYKQLYYDYETFEEIGKYFNINTNKAYKFQKLNNIDKRIRKVWNKDLTKEIDIRVKRNSEKTKIGCNRPEYLKKLSERQKKIQQQRTIEERKEIGKKGAKNRRSYKGKNNPQYGKHTNKGQTKENCEWRKKASEKIKGQNNPMFRKNRKYYYSYIGFRNDLKHICRSSWEANFARILKFENIKYLYEEKTFEIYDNKTYTPDFFIPEKNIFYEIKGYVKDNDFKKIKYVFDKYGITIILIGPKEYNKLKKQYENLIDWENDVISFKKRVENIKFIEVGIKKIVKYTYSPQKIYNLSLEGNDCFIANKIVVHNTAPHEIKAKNAKALTIPQAGGELAWQGNKRKTRITKGGKTKITDVIFRKKVWHPGTAPTFFLRNAADKNRDMFIKEFAKNLKKF